MKILKPIREQARFIDNFYRHMKNTGEWYMGGGWGISGFAGKLQRNHKGPDMCMPAVLKEDVVNYLLDEKFSLEMPTESKLVARNDDVRAYIVFMDYDDGCYTFSTEKFYKNMRIPVRFFRQHEGKVPQVKIKKKALEFPCLTPALLYVSKQAYKDEMRPKDKKDLKSIVDKVEKSYTEEEKEKFYEETKELMNIIFRD